MPEMWKGGPLCQGVCCWPSGKLAALDATDQAEEGYDIVTHDNELLCDFMHVSMLLAVNPASAYHVVGSINGMSIKFTLDTGAAVSLINEDTWNNLANLTVKPLTRWGGCQLVGVEGSPIPVVGVADVEVSFSGVNARAEFIVAKTLIADAILGLDFLKQNQCVINAEQRVLHLKGRALALSNTNSTSKTTLVDAKAVLYESLCLPPLSEVEIMVKVKSKPVSADVCLVEAVP